MTILILTLPNDGTAEKLEGLDIKVLRHPRNLGKGRALRTGLEAARKAGFRFALTIDADGELDPHRTGVCLFAA